MRSGKHEETEPSAEDSGSLLPDPEAVGPESNVVCRLLVERAARDGGGGFAAGRWRRTALLAIPALGAGWALGRYPSLRLAEQSEVGNALLWGLAILAWDVLLQVGAGRGRLAGLRLGDLESLAHTPVSNHEIAVGVWSAGVRLARRPGERLAIHVALAVLATVGILAWTLGARGLIPWRVLGAGLGYGVFEYNVRARCEAWQLGRCGREAMALVRRLCEPYEYDRYFVRYGLGRILDVDHDDSGLSNRPLSLNNVTVLLLILVSPSALVMDMFVCPAFGFIFARSQTALTPGGKRELYHRLERCIAIMMSEPEKFLNPAIRSRAERG